MQSTTDEPAGDAAWLEMQPVLNEALDELSEADRCAVLLRFFEKRSLKEIASALALSEDAAKKRVARAVEKLRLIFRRRGLVLPATVLLAALSAQTSVAAPVGLAASVATGAVLHASVAIASTLTITQTLLKVMALSKLKTLTIGAAALLVVGGTTTYVVHEHLVARAGAARQSDDAVLSIIDSLNSAQLDQAAPLVFLRPSRDSQRAGTIASNGRMMGRHVGLRELLASAYGTSQHRIVLPDGTADLHFDFLVSLPTGQKEALQAAIAEKVGLFGRVEKRDVDVYVLGLSEGESPGRQPNVEGGRGMSVRANDGAINIENGRLDGLARTLETHLGCPVVDESRVKDRYDMTLTWDVRGDDAERSGLRRAVAEQLGLKLKRDKRLLDFLLVEHTKRS